MTSGPFQQANGSLFKALQVRWHRQQSRQQILRSQVGFATQLSSRPAACQGCIHYHGKAYGTTRETRTQLICAMHPEGWAGLSGCPDWQGEPHEVRQ